MYIASKKTLDSVSELKLLPIWKIIFVLNHIFAKTMLQKYILGNNTGFVEDIALQVVL